MTRSWVLALVAGLLSACGTTVPVTTTETLGSQAPGGVASSTLGSQVPGGLGSPGVPGDALPGGAPGAPGTTAATTPGSAATVLAPSATGLASNDRTPVRLGVPYVDQQKRNAAASAIGGAGLTTGDVKAAYQALVKQLNAAGGILGHPVQAFYYAVDESQNQSTFEQATCTYFTQDHRVDFVADVVDLRMSAGYLSCLNKAGVAVVSAAQSRFTTATERRVDGFVQPATAALDRVAAREPAQLDRMGFFGTKATAKVGILYFDEPQFTAAAAVLKKAVEDRGLTVAVSQPIHFTASTADIPQTGQDAQAAVLRFRAAGVTHVLFVEEDALIAGLFGIQAASQSYYPRYGYTSQERLGNVASNVPRQALKGALFLGWNPVHDVLDPAQLPAAGHSCLAFFRQQAQPERTPNERATLVTSCETMRFLERVLAAAGSVHGVAALHAGTAALRSYASGQTFGVGFPDGRTDGVTEIRDGAWNDGCGCFAYTSAPHAL